jgi:hypothetical protein
VCHGAGRAVRKGDDVTETAEPDEPGRALPPEYQEESPTRPLPTGNLGGGMVPGTQPQGFPGGRAPGAEAGPPTDTEKTDRFTWGRLVE